MDARYAARRLVRRPLYALLSVLTLALGIGGTASVYAIARPILLDPLPYRAEKELAAFWMPFDWSEQEFLYLRGRFPGFSDVAAYRTDNVLLDRGDGQVRLLPTIFSSAELFSVLGTRPTLGRGFQRGEDARGAEPVAVISYGLWQELGGDRAIVGSRLRIDGQPRTVVGVMPSGFWFPDPNTRIWIPQPLRENNRSGNYAFIGRFAPGLTIDRMSGPIAQFVKILDDRFDYPAQWDKTKSPVLTPVRKYLVGSLTPALVATFVAMGLILLIACANVAALMLGQVEGRSTELAVRSALGANRVRLTQQLVAEAALLGIAAGVVGALLATVAFRGLVAALPLGAWGDAASLDWSLFLAAMAAAVLAAAIVAVAPGVAMWRGSLRDTLGSSRTGGIAGRGGRLEGSLVVAEVALAVVMAAGAGLLVRSVAKLYAIDPGVDTHDVGVVDVVLPNEMQLPRRFQALREVTDALKALPGAKGTGVTQILPMRGGGWSSGIRVEGNAEGEITTTFVRMVSPGYLDAMGVKLRDGRMFTDADRTNAANQPRIIINEALARKYFAGVNPLGRRISTGMSDSLGVVIGIVDDVAEGHLTDAAAPARYMLYESMSFMPSGNAIVFRTSGRDAESALDEARATVRRVIPGAGVEHVSTMETELAKAIGPARQVMMLLAILTALALVLGAVGVYGVISHFVSRRSRDWGVRLALGMMPAKVIRMIVVRGTGLVSLGIVIGIAVFFALARLLGSLLYGVGASDPIAMATATVVLLVVGVLAAAIPGLRASRTDPAIVLREQ
jgi:predicted permease